MPKGQDGQFVKFKANGELKRWTTGRRTETRPHSNSCPSHKLLTYSPRCVFLGLAKRKAISWLQGSTTCVEKMGGNCRAAWGGRDQIQFPRISGRFFCSFHLIHAPDGFSQVSLCSILSGACLSSHSAKDLESRSWVQVGDSVGHARKACEGMGKESQKAKEPIKGQLISRWLTWAPGNE